MTTAAAPILAPNDFRPQPSFAWLEDVVKPWQAGAALTFLATGGYVFTLGAGFVWGDAQAVITNPLVHSPGGLAYVWSHPFAPTPYAPMAATLYAAEHALWGNDAVAYHAVSIALHALNGLLLWTLLRKLAAPGAWLAAALFAAHPANAPAVAWVSQQGVLLATALSLTALLAFVRWLEPESDEQRFGEPRTLRLPSHPAFFFGAALCACAGATLSDAAVSTLLLIACIPILLRWRPVMTRPQRLALIPLGGIAVATVALAAWGVRADLFAQVSSAGTRAGASLAGLVAPAPRLANFPIVMSETWAGVLVTGSAVVVFAAAVTRLNRRVPADALVAIVLLGAGLIVPALLRRPVIRAWDVTVAEPIVYPAAAPLCALVAPLILRLAAKAAARAPGSAGQRVVAAAVVAAVILPLALATPAAAARFADAGAFWTAALSSEPTRPLALRQLGAAALDARRPQEAERFYSAARDLNPADTEAIDGIARSLVARDRLHDAAVIYRQGLRNAGADGDVRLLRGLAALQARRGVADEAVALYERALERSQDDATLHYELATVYAAVGRQDDAVARYRRAIALAPAYLAPKLDLAVALLKAGRADEAAALLHEVNRLDPDNFEAFATSGAILEAAKDYRQAERMFRRAVALRADSRDAWQHLAVTLDAQGRPSEADWCRAQAERVGEAPTVPPTPKTSSPAAADQ